VETGDRKSELEKQEAFDDGKGILIQEKMKAC
jgi:hypothetical protein